MKNFKLNRLSLLLIFISSFALANVCKESFNKPAANKNSYDKDAFSMVQLIEKKSHKEEHTLEEIEFIVEGFTRGDIPDYQMSSWFMAVLLNGLTDAENGNLAKAMLYSGEVLDFGKDRSKVVDKHSIGGVGDKTSFILAPICATCDLKVPMISGRGLGHTGGTLDKLESFKNFNVNLTLEHMKKQVNDLGFFIASQTEEIAPADKKMYALRNLTATTHSSHLTSSSIVSTKLTEGLSALVMDMKFGSGSIMKTKEDTKALALDLKKIAEHNGVKFRGVITNMDQPLGRFVGNSVEIQEVLTILKNEIPAEHAKFYNSTKELSVALAAHMIHITGRAKTFEEATALALSKLEDGSAFEAFEKMCHAQGTCNLDLPMDRVKKMEIKSPESGYISEMNTADIGWSSIELGAGRRKKEDQIDYQTGIEMNVRLGDAIKKGEPLAIFYYSKNSNVKKAEEFFIQAIRFSDTKVKPPKLIHGTVE